MIRMVWTVLDRVATENGEIRMGRATWNLKSIPPHFLTRGA